MSRNTREMQDCGDQSCGHLGAAASNWEGNRRLHLRGISSLTVRGRGMSVGGEGRAGIRVRVNEAPAPGICQVCVAGLQDCVQAGLALVDSFVMACSMFPDGDKPLSYRFGFAYDDGHTWFDSTFASRLTSSTSHRNICPFGPSLWQSWRLFTIHTS